MTSNLYQKAKRSVRGIALAGLVSAVAGCAEPEVKTGVIEKESFYPKASINGFDRYTALIKTLGGEIITVSHIGMEAIEIDLRYDVGDTVSLIRHPGTKPYKIIQ